MDGRIEGEWLDRVADLLTRPTGPETDFRDDPRSGFAAAVGSRRSTWAEPYAVR